MSEILRNDCLTFKVNGQVIDFYSEEVNQALSTVAEYNNAYHYLGSVEANIATAIYIWQHFNSAKLSDEDIIEVLKENNIIDKNYVKGNLK